MSSNLTTTLSLLLVAAQVCKPEDYEYRTAEIIENLMDISGWPDQRKADLYALLVESIEVDDGMLTIEKKVHAALQKNEAHFYGRVV